MKRSERSTRNRGVDCGLDDERKSCDCVLAQISGLDRTEAGELAL